jgi:hypothetical protein
MEQELARLLGQAVTVVPNKTYEKTMVIIDNDCRLYRRGERAESAFLEARFNEEIGFDYKQEFTKRAFEIMESVLNVPCDQVYVNIIELIHNWGSRGVLK